MKPAFRLRAGDAEVPVGDRLLDLKATSTSDDASDALELTLDNRGAAVALPSPGGELEAWLGYAPSSGYLGRFLFADLEVSFPPLRLTLRATAADFGRASTLKAPRTRNWPEGLTLGRVAETLADAHGSRARVTPALAAVPVENLDHSPAESDLALLARLAAARGAAAKADARHLLVPRGAGTSVSGKPLTAAIRPEDVLSACASPRERTRTLPPRPSTTTSTPAKPKRSSRCAASGPPAPPPKPPSPTASGLPPNSTSPRPLPMAAYNRRAEGAGDPPHLRGRRTDPGPGERAAYGRESAERREAGRSRARRGTISALGRREAGGGPGRRARPPLK